MLVTDRFRRQCRVLQVLAIGLMAALAVLLAVVFVLVPWLAWLQSDGAGASGRQLLLGLVRASPALGYLWALWAVQRALGELAAGRLFHDAVSRAMRHMGYGVIVGALLSVFAITNLARMIEHGRGGFMYFDLSGIVLAVVGAALILLARLVDQARALQTELDEIL